MMNNHSASSSLDAFSSCPPYHQPWSSYAPSPATHPGPDSWATHSCSSLYSNPVSHQYHHHHQLSGHHPHADAFAVHQYHAAAHPYSSIPYGYMTASSSPSSPTRHPEIITTVESANLTLTPPSSDPQTVIKPASSPILLSPNVVSTDQSPFITNPDLIKSEGLNGETIEDGNNGNCGHLNGRPQPARSPYEWMTKKAVPYNNNGSQPPPGKTRTRDKYRVVYSDHQRQELEKEFHESRYITIRRKAELAQNLFLSERQVKIWFQNRRAKERKQSKKKDDGSKKDKLSSNTSIDPHPTHIHHHHHGNSPPPNHMISNHLSNGNAMSGKIHDPYTGILHHHPHLICSPSTFGATSVPLSSIQPQY